MMLRFQSLLLLIGFALSACTGPIAVPPSGPRATTSPLVPPPVLTVEPLQTLTPEPTSSPTPTEVATREPTAIPTSSLPCNDIVYSAVRAGNYDLYSVCPDGSSVTRLTTDPADDTQPAWSPDGQNIVFTSNRAQPGQIFIMDADGGNVIQVTNGDLSHSAPIWLPDGQHLAYLTTDNKGLWWWNVSQLDGREEMQITPKTFTFFDAWAWSPDGKHIAYVSYEEQKARNDGAGEIHVMDADHSHDQRLTNNVWRDQTPVWSRDSSKIAFLSDRDGNPRVFAVYVMDADGANQRRVSDIIFSDQTKMSWSPDGQKIAIDAWPLSPGSPVSEIFLLDMASGQLSQLTHTSVADENKKSPAWQP